jgi:hypothetical protein
MIQLIKYVFVREGEKGKYNVAKCMMKEGK